MRYVGASAVVVAVLLGLLGASPTPALSRARPPVAHRTRTRATPSPVPPAGTPVATEHVEVVETTTDLTERMRRLSDRRFTPGVLFGLPAIDVDDSMHYQRIGGFGAAMTDSSAWLLEHAARDPAGALAELFGPGGIHLGFLRVPMGASDFTANGHPYTYDDLPAGRSDPGLADFSIAHDEQYLIPALRSAQTLNPRLQMIATPWSPPAWMKANQSLDNTLHRGTLRGPAAGAWARYLVRFLQAYRDEGVFVDSLSLQNEPGTATTYPGLEIPAAQADSLLVHALVPALRAVDLSDVKLYGGELGWGPRARTYARTVARSGAAADLTGMAWHCYFGSPDAMDSVHVLAPKLEQIVSECATGLVPFPPSELLIGALRNWASSVALWNIALDPAGGPVEQPNTGCPGCSALLTVDEATGAVAPTLSLFQLGQVSRFVQRGAVRIGSEHYVAYHYDWRHMTQSIVSPGLDDVAFRNPDGSRVLLVYANQATPVSFTVNWHGSWFAYTLAGGATATFLWRP